MKQRPEPPHLAAHCTLIDSHCHLDMDAYQGKLDTVIQSAKHAGITRIITIGIDLASSKKAVELADQHSEVFATVGVHPHSVEEATETGYAEIAQLASHPKVIGYGEIGLDYAKLYAPVDVQQKEFVRQLTLARELHLPVVIHDRDAHQDTLTMLRKCGPFPDGGVMHCFSGDTSFAEHVLALGFYISIPGIVTFKNAKALQQVVMETPLERMLLETDGPFLAPVPWRGKVNRPDYMLYTAAKVAELKNCSIETVAAQTSRNTTNLFSLPHKSRI
jgi:TatD DNase family protein